MDTQKPKFDSDATKAISRSIGVTTGVYSSILLRKVNSDAYATGVYSLT